MSWVMSSSRDHISCTGVPGMVGAPGIASAAQSGEGGAVAEWSASENMNVDLYGPPPTSIDPVDEPIQVLYGPSPVFADEENPMQASAKLVTVKEARLAVGKKVVKRAIVVEDAVGDVYFQKVGKKSSKRLRVNENTGAVIVKKGTKAGLYKMRVKVTAAGNAQYRPAIQTVVVKVRVK